MQHGLLADGFSWIPNLANQSAGFVFADAGFDVWIANSRGTPASQKHIGYGPESQKFWNFTWQEMSEFDLTSSVYYVLKETKQEFLYYLGHSQGTMIMFSRLAEDREFSKKVRYLFTLFHINISFPDSSFPRIGSSCYCFSHRRTLRIIWETISHLC